MKIGVVIPPNLSDYSRIQQNLDEKGTSLLVVERGNPEQIMTAEKYAQQEVLWTTNFDRNRVVCATFGNNSEKWEFDLNDLELYRSI